MINYRSTLGTAALALAAASQAVVLGQIDTFEDGTTQNWAVNLLGQGGSHPFPPANIPTGGPFGADDNFLLMKSFGGSGAGNRLVVLNPAQWSGDYTSAGVFGIEMDVNNFGPTDLKLRLLFENPIAGPPTDLAISSTAITVAAGSGWQKIVFSANPGDLTALLGSVGTVLSNTTLLRLYHGDASGFPGEPILGELGVDNILAVPEPATMAALGLGALALLRRRR
jgi:hypothetical protein